MVFCRVTRGRYRLSRLGGQVNPPPTLHWWGVGGRDLHQSGWSLGFKPTGTIRPILRLEVRMDRVTGDFLVLHKRVSGVQTRANM